MGPNLFKITILFLLLSLVLCKKKCATCKKGQKIKKACFEEWTTWEKDFPNCNPKSNPSLGPIHIDTKKVVRTEEKALIVYSGTPQAALYFYSTEYEMDGVLIQAVNIHSRRENFKDTTYIAGVGSEDYRYFQKAMFLFTVTDVEPERSLHTIDGKKFLLEIVMTFADLPRSGEAPTDVTQVHVMVEKSKSIYPGWKFLEDGIVGINAVSDVGIDSTQIVQAAKDDLRVKSQMLEELKAMEKNELGASFTYADLAADLKTLHTLVSTAENTLELSTLLNQLKSSQTTLSATKQTHTKAKNNLLTKTDSLKSDILRNIQAGIMLHGDSNEKTEKLEGLQSELRETETLLSEVTVSLKKSQIRLFDVEEELKKKEELLMRYRIGDMKGAQFPSVRKLKEALDDMEGKAKALKMTEEDVTGAKDKLETVQSQSARDVLLAKDPFQVSWLFPAIGGYFRYNSSSPLPPCAPRTRVIVLETPIGMSQEQFNVISNFTIRGRYQAEIDLGVEKTSMDRTMPIMREVGGRQVFYNRKNIQFKFDDAMHMTSKLRRKIKDGLVVVKAAGVWVRGCCWWVVVVVLVALM